MASELTAIYDDKAAVQEFNQETLLDLARRMRHEITFQRYDGYSLSAADAFLLLTNAMASYVQPQQWPPRTTLVGVYGPARRFSPSIGGARPSAVPWSAFAAAVRDTADYLQASGRIPDEIWIGSQNFSPADYLATLADVTEGIASGGATPASVTIREGAFTPDRYVAPDTPGLWSWVIFPDGFHAPHLMELARLQAWTLKPAMLAQPGRR
jgi:hypothetical protein